MPVPCISNIIKNFNIFFLSQTGASKFFRQWSRNKWGNFPRNGQIRADVGQTCLPFFTTIFIVHSVLFAFPYGHYFHFSLFCYVCVRDVISMLFMSLMVVLMQQEFIDHRAWNLQTSVIDHESWKLNIYINQWFLVFLIFFTYQVNNFLSRTLQAKSHIMDFVLSDHCLRTLYGTDSSSGIFVDDPLRSKVNVKTFLDNTDYE